MHQLARVGADDVHAEDPARLLVEDELEHPVGRKDAAAQASVVRGDPLLGVEALGDGLVLGEAVVANLRDRPHPNREVVTRGDARRAKHRRDGALRLVDARRRERGPLDAVARGEDALDARLEGAVHLDVAALGQRDAGSLEPDARALADGRSPHRRQVDIGLERALVLVELQHDGGARLDADGVEGREAELAALARHLGKGIDLRVLHDLDAVVGEALEQPLGDRRVEADALEGAHCAAAHQHRHVGAKHAEDLGILDRDDAGADDDHRLRQEVERVDRVRVEDAHVVKRDRADACRLRAEAEEHLLGRDVDRLAVGVLHDGQRVLALLLGVRGQHAERGLALQVADAEGREQLAHVVGVVAREAKAVVAHLPPDHVLVEAHRAHRVDVERLANVAERLGEEAGWPAEAKVEAATRRRGLGLIDDQHALAELGRLGCAGDAGRAAADDDQVVLLGQLGGIDAADGRARLEADLLHDRCRRRRSRGGDGVRLLEDF